MAVTKKPKKFIHSRSHSNHEKLFMKILVSKKEGFELKNVKYAFNNSDLIRDPRTKTDLKLFRNRIRSIPKTNCSR